MDRLFLQIPLWPGQPPLEASSPQRTSRTLLWVTVLASITLHLLFVVFIPQPKPISAVGQQQRVLQLHMKPVVGKKSEAASTVEESASRAKSVRTGRARKQKHQLQHPETTVVKAPSGAPVISIAEALRQTLIESNSGIRCTPLQRRQRLINCDDIHMVSDVGRLTGSDLSRSLDATLAIAVPISERTMAQQARQLLFERKQLEGAATSIISGSEFLQAQVVEDLRQMRRQSDTLDRQRSSFDLFGVTVDTYRASDSHTRNPNVFNQGRL